MDLVFLSFELFKSMFIFFSKRCREKVVEKLKPAENIYKKTTQYILNFNLNYFGLN